MRGHKKRNEYDENGGKKVTTRCRGLTAVRASELEGCCTWWGRKKIGEKNGEGVIQASPTRTEYRVSSWHVVDSRMNDHVAT